MLTIRHGFLRTKKTFYTTKNKSNIDVRLKTITSVNNEFPKSIPYDGDLLLENIVKLTEEERAQVIPDMMKQEISYYKNHTTYYGYNPRDKEWFDEN